MTFVAFDPKRAKSLGNIRKAITLGAAGVKFYLPNGYRPAGNAKNPEWDAAAAALFEWCAPILTHCTPSGFAADIDNDSGCNSDPKYWKSVLEKNRNLRLCFGHAAATSGGWTSS